jgi:hypothetical protein
MSMWYKGQQYPGNFLRWRSSGLECLRGRST